MPARRAFVVDHPLVEHKLSWLRTCARRRVRLAQPRPLVVPLLRAGLGMLDRGAESITAL